MTNLEDRIASWRRELTAALGDRADVLDELEDHLRHEYDALLRAGRTADEAWHAAVAKLGRTPQLAAEFRKSTRGWLPSQVAAVVLGVTGVVAGAFLIARVAGAQVGVLLAAHVFAITVGYCATLAFGFTAAAAVVSHAAGSFGPRQSDALRQTGVRVLLAVAVVMALLGVVLGACWTRAYRGHYWQWDPREIGGACVVIWNAAVLALLWRKGSAGTAAAAMVGGVVANAIVIAAWFGPLLLDSRMTALPAWYAPLLAAVVMGHLGLALAGLMPAGWLRRRREAQGAS